MNVHFSVWNFCALLTCLFVCLFVFLFVLMDAQEKQIGFATLGRERPRGWDIAHVKNNFIDLYPAL